MPLGRNGDAMSETSASNEAVRTDAEGGPPGGSRAGRRVFQWLFVCALSASLVALIIVTFDFVFSPYRDLPVNGLIDGKRHTWGHLVENNRYGFRERDFESPKPCDVYRVMGLGDSLTWGAGLAVNERYTDIAEQLLRNALPHKGDRNSEFWGEWRAHDAGKRHIAAIQAGGRSESCRRRLLPERRSAETAGPQ